MHNQRLLRRMLDEGHQVTNHGYRHVLFGEKPFVYGKRDHFHGLDQVVSDPTRLHTLLKETYGYEMTMARPPHYVDKIEGALPATMPMTRWDTSIWPLPLTGQVGCRCTTARPRRACGRRWRPWWTPCEGAGGGPRQVGRSNHFSRKTANMCRRTPVAFGLKKQLELLKKYGYQVVTVQRLGRTARFGCGPGDPGFESWSASEDRGIVYQTTWLRPGRPYDLGELAMLLAPGEAMPPDSENPETGSPARQLGAMDWCAEQGF